MDNLSKVDLLKLAFPLGEFVNEYVSVLAEIDFQICKLYQDYALSYAESSFEKDTLMSYWAERAIEDFALTHQRHNCFLGIYPDSCLYQSDLIKKLRAEYSRSHGPELHPVLNRMFKSEHENMAIRDNFRLKISQRKMLEKEKHCVNDMTEFNNADLEKKKQGAVLDNT